MLSGEVELHEGLQIDTTHFTLNKWQIVIKLEELPALFKWFFSLLFLFKNEYSWIYTCVMCTEATFLYAAPIIPVKIILILHNYIVLIFYITLNTS